MSESKQTENQQPSWYQIFLLLGLLCSLGVYTQIHKLERFYFLHYEEIYLILYGMIAALSAFVGKQIVKHTAELSIRVRRLNDASDGDEKIHVGMTHDRCPITLSNAARTGHVQIIGSTGRGKTKSVITAWMARDILKGRSSILIDGKGDPEIADAIGDVIGMVPGRPEFHVFDLGNPGLSAAINPLRRGTAQQITDRIFTAFTFDDAYYKSVQYDITGSVIQLIHENQEAVTFRRLYECLTRDEKMSELVTKSRTQPLKEKVSRFLGFPKIQRDQQLSGLLSQIGPFAVGEIAPLVNGGAMHLSDVVLKKEQQVYLFLIPTLKYQEIGHQLGKLLLQELGWAIGERASRGENNRFVPVYLDEFSSFVYKGFTNILNKARSSNVALHLSHQSLGDLSTVSDDFANIIMTNTNVKCILGLNDPESADYIARHLGTHSEDKITERAQKDRLFGGVQKSGEVSIRQVEAYKVHPNILKSLSYGRGVLHLPTRFGNLTEQLQFEAFDPEEGGAL